MPIFRRKIEIVDAVQFTGDNRREVLTFAYRKLSAQALHGAEVMRLPIIIETVDGEVSATPGDWICREVDGRMTVLDAQTFGLIFEAVDRLMQL